VQSKSSSATLAAPKPRYGVSCWGKNVKKLFASAVALPVSERLLLAGFLDLVALTDGHVFCLNADPQAPIRFINTASQAGMEILAHREQGIAYICLGSESVASDEGVWHLPMPIRFSVLRGVLAAVVAQRAQWHRKELAQMKLGTALENAREILIARTEVNPELATVSAHRRLEQFLRVLDRALRQGLPQQFRGIPDLELILTPLTGEVFLRSLSVRPWLELISRSKQSVFLTPFDAQITHQDYKALSVARFRWQLARHMSYGVLLPSIAHLGQFGLSRWPDFGALGVDDRYDLRVCALMANRAVSVEMIMQLCSVSRLAAIGLINACALDGSLRGISKESVLEAIAPQQVHVEQVPKPVLKSNAAPVQRGFVAFLGKIRAALKIGSGASAQ
jgi:hypothetical protein